MKLNQLPAASLLVALCAVSSAHAAVTVKKVTAVTSTTTSSVALPTGTDPSREPRHEPPTGGDRLTPLQKLLLAIWWKNHHSGPSLS